MGKPSNNKGFMGRVRAFGYAYEGLCAAWRDEPAFRAEVITFIFLIPAAFWVSPHASERAILIASCFLTLITELVNSAIEAAIDRHGSGIHPLSKKAKDIASAALSTSLINLIIVWAIIFVSNFDRLFQS